MLYRFPHANGLKRRGLLDEAVLAALLGEG